MQLLAESQNNRVNGSEDEPHYRSPAQPGFQTLDANEAAGRVAYALWEVIAIYPITPASPIGEWSDTWSVTGIKNLWHTMPSVIEMQSEGGGRRDSWRTANGGADAAKLVATGIDHPELDFIMPDQVSHVLAKTKMLGPGDSDSITFTAPPEPGSARICLHLSRALCQRDERCHDRKIHQRDDSA